MSEKKLTEIFTESQEKLTGFIANIGSDHAYIHQGIAYTSIVTTPSISAAYRLAFKTPAAASGIFIHWRPIGITSSANYVDFAITEAETYTGGTAVTPINRNRISSNTSSMQAFAYGVTSTPAGVIIDKSGIGTSGTPRARSGGGTGAEQELVLKQDTTYVVTLTPAGATIVNLSLFWYEEERGV